MSKAYRNSSRLKLQDGKQYVFAIEDNHVLVMGRHCDLRLDYDEALKFLFELHLLMRRYAATLESPEPIRYGVDRDIALDNTHVATCSWLPDLPKGFKIEEE